MMAMQLAEDGDVPKIVDTYFPQVQAEKKCGVFLVATFHAKDEKDAKKDKNHMVLYKLAFSKNKFDTLKKKAKKTAEDAKKQCEDDNKEAFEFVENANDAADQKANHKAFVAHMEAASQASNRPIVGIIECLTKIFYVTYVREGMTDDLKGADKKAGMAAKTVFPTIRRVFKDKLGKVNESIAATELSEMEWKIFEEKGPKI